MNKLNYLFRFVRLPIYFLFCICLNVLASVAVNGDQNLHIHFSSKTKNNAENNKNEISKARFLKDSERVEFNLSARMAIQSRPSLVVSDRLGFALSHEVTPSLLGWHINENLFTWQGDMGRAQPIGLLLQHSNQAKEINLNNFDALLIDYADIPGIARCVPNLSLSTQVQTYGPEPKISKANWSTALTSDLKVLNSVGAHESDWRAMDNFYFISRLLRLEPDTHWRYRQIDSFTLLQRRMHLNLEDALVMEITLKPGTALERVNLMVKTKDGLGKGEIVEFNNLPAPTVLSDGRLGVRLDLSEALQRRFPDAFAKGSKEDDKPPLFLQEIFFYFPGAAGRTAADKPLVGFSLLGNIDIAEDGATSSNKLNTADGVLNATSRRIKIDLRPINSKGRVDLEKAMVRLSPGPGDGPCAIQLNQVRLVGTYNQKVPVYASQVEDWSRRWGGPFKLTAPGYDQLEQPGIISYLPLSALDETRVRISKVNAPGYWQISGDTAQVGIDWPVNARIGPDTLFYAASDSPEQIAGLAVTMRTADGRQLKRLVPPNTAVPLVATPTQLKSVQIATNSRAAPHQLKIKELVLFEPSVISYAEAFRLRLPREVSIIPIPLPSGDVSDWLTLRPGHASGLVRGDTQNFRFTTKLDTPLENMRGLSLKFRLHPQIETGGPCPLRLTFKFERATLERQLCPNTLIGQVFVPLAAWLGNEEAGRKLGALRSIDWAMQLTGSYAKDRPASFSLDFSIEGWAYQSAADRLLSAPLFKVAGKPVYAKKESLTADGGKLPNTLWLPLEQDAVEKLFGSNGEIIPVENDLFKLEHVVLKPTKPLDRETWEKITTLPKPIVPPRWPKWLLWASFLLLAWASARKGWWSPAKTWLFVKRLSYLLYWAVSKSTSDVGRRFWFMLPWTATWELRLPGLARLLGWSLVTVALYGAGLFQRVQKGENYFFTLGGMAAVLALRATFLLLKPWLRRAHPSLAASVFDGAGSLYFAGAIVGLVGSALLLSLRIEPLAEQLAVVVYYCLVVGTVLEVVALRRDRQAQAETTNPVQEKPMA